MAKRKVEVELRADDNASAKIAGVASHLRLLRDQSEVAGRGMGRIGNLLGDMAREALGATGPLGRLGEKLLEFGIGGGAFIAIAAGVALIYKGFQFLNKAASDAEEAYKSYIKTLQGSASALVIVGTQLDELGAKVARLNETGFLGAARRVNRAILSRSLLGQIFGVQSKEELEAELADVRKRAAEMPAQLHAAAVAAAAKLPKPKLTDAEKEAAALLAHNLARQRAERIAAGGGGNVIGTAGAAPLSGETPAILQGASTELREQARAAEAAAAAVNNLRDAYKNAGDITIGVAEGLQALSGSLLGSIPGFGAVSKAASKAAGLIAKVEGTVAIAKGAVKIAESIFPFNPAGFASGSAMIAQGTKLAALGGGGGGGGGGSRGGGGGLAPDQAARNQRELAAARAQRPSVTLKRGYVRTDDPDFQDFILELIRNGGGRDSDLSYTG